LKATADNGVMPFSVARLTSTQSAFTKQRMMAKGAALYAHWNKGSGPVRTPVDRHGE
jgi:hypothetical protein